MIDKTPFDISTFLAKLPKLPGVYQMKNEQGDTLYVGKAKALKPRVTSYFKSTVSGKTRALVEQIKRIDITVTHSEAEALILESTLIKRLAPRYNILLRDDKSYPYIYVAWQDDFPRIELYRTRSIAKKPGRFFGPFPSALAVKETLALLQKVFLLRTCKNSYFNHRSRPCLQHQIGRCSAPCVGLIAKDAYRARVQLAMDFLDGKSSQVIATLEQTMAAFVDRLAYEQAATIRNQIQQLRQVQSKQAVSQSAGEADVLAACYLEGQACIALLRVREGQLLAAETFFPSLPSHAFYTQEQNTSVTEITSALLVAFISQYYLLEAKRLPKELIAPIDKDQALIEALRISGTATKLIRRPQGVKNSWRMLAESNALVALKSRLATRASSLKRYTELQSVLGLATMPVRIECFDISHTAGELTVGSCVVFTLEGPLKSDYRRFNIEGITPGDDYAAMKQVVRRRYERMQKEQSTWPSLLLIDGGPGQVSQAREVLSALGMDAIPMVGVAKGEGRKAGLETLIISASDKRINLADDSPALHLIQHIRDEAHRFAITGHRGRRQKARRQSVLDSIDGIGSKRKAALLRYFGGSQGLNAASVDDLTKVSGISSALAEKIYASLHS